MSAAEGKCCSKVSECPDVLAIAGTSRASKHQIAFCEVAASWQYHLSTVLLSVDLQANAAVIRSRTLERGRGTGPGLHSSTPSARRSRTWCSVVQT